MSPYVELLEELDHILESTNQDGQQRDWIETLPFSWGEVLIDLMPGLEPEYRRLDRARHQLEGEIYKRLGVTPPWHLAARVDDGKIHVYGHEPLSCDSVVIADGEQLSWAVCKDVEIIYVIGKLSAFLRQPILMDSNQPHRLRYFLFNIETMEDKPLRL